MTDNDADYLTEPDLDSMNPQDRAEYEAQRLRMDILVYLMNHPDGTTVEQIAADTQCFADNARAIVEHLINNERLATRDSNGTLHYRAKPWSEMYPDGREIFYEGDDPAGFAATVRDRFGFDPSATATWGETLFDGRETFQSYAFHCPAEHLDTLYGTGEYPLGS